MIVTEIYGVFQKIRQGNGRSVGLCDVSAMAFGMIETAGHHCLQIGKVGSPKM